MANTCEDINTLSSEPSKLAKYGISLLINNRFQEAEDLFSNHSDSIQMTAGYALVVFMDALMSFEEDKLEIALNRLHDTEKRCATDIGWMKTVKNRFLGVKSMNTADRLETQIILADTQVCIALVTFLQQEFSGYLKGGWVLRKAWKIYYHTYLEIVNLYKQKFGDFNLPEPTDFQWSDSCSKSPTEDQEEWIIPDSNSTSPRPVKKNGTSNEMNPETVARLMSAVCFGYGLLQLGLSLLPPSLLKVTNFFGFQANRPVGISNLMYSRKGTDMRAPLATLSLLWYHTIVRPFYALDGSNVKAGIEASILLMQEAKKEYGESALFLFFKGRIHRLDSNIPMALESFQAAVNNSSQREIKLLALHEVGWCYLMQLDYQQAQKVFLKLNRGSRWSKSFYFFLSIICSGSCGKREFNKIEELREAYQETQRNNQLDAYIRKRLNLFPVTNEDLQQTHDVFWKMFVYELLYLWNALPSCSYSCIDSIIVDCNETTREPIPGLAKLIQGECFNIIGLYDKAVACFRQCIATRSNITPNEDLHISAYCEYTLGMLLIKNLMAPDEGKSLLEHCSHYKDYDFDNKLLVQINTALKNVS